MINTYSDASFNWKKEIHNSDKVGIIAFQVNNTLIVKQIIIPSIPGLKQYINLLELKATVECFKYCLENNISSINHFTDSKVVYSWIKTNKNSLGKFSEQHYQAKQDIEELKNKLFVRINWIERNKNLAGIALEKLGY